MTTSISSPAAPILSTGGACCGLLATRSCSTTHGLRRFEARSRHEAEIDRMISDSTQRHDKHEAMRLVGAAGVPAGAVLDTGDLLAEPSFAEGGIIQTMTMQHPNGEFRLPAFPVRFDGRPVAVEAVAAAR
jgi:crotonobetainyl-CoA:carnitine CoA-transferase CaiB-like acyl-CoA transferase